MEVLVNPVLLLAFSVLAVVVTVTTALALASRGTSWLARRQTELAASVAQVSGQLRELQLGVLELQGKRDVGVKIDAPPGVGGGVLYVRVSSGSSVEVGNATPKWESLTRGRLNAVTPPPLEGPRLAEQLQRVADRLENAAGGEPWSSMSELREIAAEVAFAEGALWASRPAPRPATPAAEACAKLRSQFAGLYGEPARASLLCGARPADGIAGDACGLPRKHVGDCKALPF